MVVSGLPMRNGDRHAVEIAKLAIELVDATQRFVIPHLPNKILQLRVGANTGACCTICPTVQGNGMFGIRVSILILTKTVATY